MDCGQSDGLLVVPPGQLNHCLHSPCCGGCIFRNGRHRIRLCEPNIDVPAVQIQVPPHFAILL